MTDTASTRRLRPSRHRRARLLVSAALPLVLATPAVAAEIGDARTAPIATATVENGAPGDITITSAGSVTLTDPGPAVRLNSNNAITNSGVITINNVNGATAVLIEGGRSGSFVNVGTISLLEDYQRTDSDGDGDLDGPVASGSGRTGILIQGATPFTGSVIQRTGAIQVEGVDSAGIRLAAGTGLNGDLRTGGTINTVGARSIAVDVQSNVSGRVELGGSIGAQGEGARGAVIAADAGGFANGATISVTGFNSVTVSDYFDPDDVAADFDPIVMDPDDHLQGGAAISIGGDLTNGFYNSGPFGDATVDDVDGADPTKDIRPDFNPNRTTGQITSFGSAPAVLISPDVNPSGDSITIGLAQEVVRDTLDDDQDTNTDEVLATFQEDFGVVNRGTIASDGLNSGFAANTVVIAGSADGARGVTIQGGILNVGSITAKSWEGDSTTMRLGAGADAGRLHNFGTISAAVATETTHTGRALLVESGGVLGELHNAGTISATIRGDEGDAIAIEDRSGTLRNIVNDGVITAAHSADFDDDDDDGRSDDTDEVVGKAVALDLSAATAGISLVQGSVTTGTAPSITGDILFGAGADTMDIRRGTVSAGLISFGAGADVLHISGADTVVSGGIADLDGSLQITATAGTLNIQNEGALQIASADFGADSRLELSVSGQQEDNRVLTATGAVHFADGAELGAVVQDLLLDSRELVLIGASDLQIDGGLESLLDLDSAFLFEQSALTRTAGAEEQLVLTLRRKSAQELGMNANQAAIYDAAMEALASDSDLNAQFGSLETGEDFFAAYDQVLPDFSGGGLQLIAANVQGAAGAVGDRIDVAAHATNRSTGVWAQEYFYYVDRSAGTAGGDFSGFGVGGAAGVDRAWGPFDAVGVNIALSTNEVTEVGGFDQPVQVATIGGGFYAGGRDGALTYGISVGGAYDQFDSERRFIMGPTERRTEGDWSGYHLHATAQASYEFDLGWLQVTPRASVDHIRLSENGYTESGGGQGIDLIVEDRDSDLTIATALVAFSHRFGDDDGWWSPALSLGGRAETGGAGDTTARFAGFDSSFTLSPEDYPGAGALAGFSITGGNLWSAFRLSYDADVRDGMIRHAGRATFRMSF
jgi:hypothetical protein